MENESGALSRVSGLFSARGYNIESLNVAPTEDETLSRMTIVTSGSNEVIEQIIKQLNKKIGENTVISQRSYICTGTHDYNSEDFRIYAVDINIGSKCWLATDVYVAPGITIKDGVVVGARSSVFSDLDANKVYVGSPAKSNKNRTVD